MRYSQKTIGRIGWLEGAAGSILNLALFYNFRVTAVQSAHAVYQVSLRCFNQQVVVVAHQAIRVTNPALLSDFRIQI